MNAMHAEQHRNPARRREGPVRAPHVPTPKIPPSLPNIRAHVRAFGPGRVSSFYGARVEGGLVTAFERFNNWTLGGELTFVRSSWALQNLRNARWDFKTITPRIRTLLFPQRVTISLLPEWRGLNYREFSLAVHAAVLEKINA